MFFLEKHPWKYKHIQILLQEFNLETKFGPTQGNTNLL